MQNTHVPKSPIDRPPKKASSVQVRSIHPPGRPRSSFNDIASVTAKTVASIELTENHDVGRGQRRNMGKPGLVSRH